MNLKKLNPSRILIVNIFGIGDVLFTTPLVSNLRHHFPGAAIDYMANKRVAPLLEDHSLIRKVHIYERDEFEAVRKQSKREFLKKFSGFVRTIKAEQYDVLFDFSMNQMFNVISSLVGIRTRIGFNYKNRSRFLTEKIKLTGFQDKHVVQYYLDLLSDCGVETIQRELEITITPEHRDWAAQFLKSNKISTDQPVLGIFPGGGSSWGKSAGSKRWGQENYIKLIHKIVEKSSVQIILMGDKSEETLCTEIVRQCPNVYKSFGQTSLGQSLALLNRCRGVVCNDGGPLHMAVAAGTNTVSMFGPVDHNVYGPWPNQKKHFVVVSGIACRPCYRKFRMTDCSHLSCLSEITVDEVFNKVGLIL
ncbi:MAG: glycosyltransferase family 9 protein [Candidatus Omnitrophota bacterium]